MIRRFYYDPETRSFTDQQTALKNKGIITQSIFHIIKLNLKLNYNYDRNGHIKSIAGWINDVRVDMIKDKHSKKIPEYITRCYLSKINLHQLLPSWNEILTKEYGYTGTLMMSDVDDAIPIFTYILGQESKLKMISELERLYPI